MERLHMLPKGKVRCLQFGVDADFWCPGEETEAGSGPYLLSVGSDAGRDYQTLALAKLPLPVRVVTRLKLPDGRALLRWEASSDTDLRELYRGATAVMIPLHDISQPSGQSAALQAMACGKAVILTQTKGFWDPKGMHGGLHYLSVRPGNPSDWENAVRTLLETPALRVAIGHHARQRVLEAYQSHHYGDSLRRICLFHLRISEKPCV
jgi:glycosyltransferase involved in cell wall biosynthesis